MGKAGNLRQALSRGAWTLQRFGFTPAKLRHRLFREAVPRLFCVSVPKAGTHLVERAICLHPALYRHFMRTLDECNLDPETGLGAELGKLKPGELIVSHLFCNEERARAVEDAGVQCIFVIRDPRDVVVSQSSYLMQMKGHRFHQAFRGVLDRKSAIRVSIVGDEESGLPSIRAILDGLCGWHEVDSLVIRFEDLIGQEGGGSEQTQKDMLRRLYRFVGLQVDDAWIDAAANEVFSTVSPTFRRGAIDQWRTLFDQELIELFKAEAGQCLIDYGYEKDFDW